MITKTAMVARQIISAGYGSTMFNDKLVDGRRSLKVWGWRHERYMYAKRLLENMGCKVEVVVTDAGSTRLHVTE